MALISSKPFGVTKDGQAVTAFELRNDAGMCVCVLNYGGTVQSILLPDAHGVVQDVVLGYDDIRSYEKGNYFYGAIVGRVANRIKDARFTLEGKEYRLKKNSRGESNHLHGVFSKKIFDASIEGETLLLHYLSPDMEEGYPGNLDLKVRYSLSEDNALTIDYEATTDQTTIINLTNHSYFNLNGHDGSGILNHKIRLFCKEFTEIGESKTPTGRILSVEGTPLDFRQEHLIGERIHEDYPQLRLCGGYDHNMILEGKGGELKPIGIARSEKTGITLEAFTTEPAIQFYTANFLGSRKLVGKANIIYPKNGGFCLEAQHYPDSINHPEFPSTALHPGEVYRQKTIYRLK